MSGQPTMHKRRTRRSLGYRMGCVALSLCLLSTSSLGCRSSSASNEKVDSTIGRAATSAGEAFAEGKVDVAVQQYRKAIARAWAIDDPYESGTNAYNLAACLLSLDQVDQAKDWLLDARYELGRASSTPANVWLLEAKIALDECRFEDAALYVCRAEGSEPPCGESDRHCGCALHDPCRESCITCIPVVGSRISEKKAASRCADGFQTQLHLTRARLAAEQYDLDCAYEHFCAACKLAEDVCSHDLQAELQDVAALIHLAKGEHQQAACHFDKEAEHLRLAGNYREIPTTLELAAASYEQAGHFRTAANRLCRVARISFGRGDTKRSWQYVQAASELAEIAGCEITKVRLSLVAQEIERTLSENDEPLPTEPETPLL